MATWLRGAHTLYLSSFVHISHVKGGTICPAVGSGGRWSSLHDILRHYHFHKTDMTCATSHPPRSLGVGRHHRVSVAVCTTGHRNRSTKPSSSRCITTRCVHTSALPPAVIVCNGTGENIPRNVCRLLLALLSFPPPLASHVHHEPTLIICMQLSMWISGCGWRGVG